jgi:ribosomal protein S12 methylthiotransferase accessory factor
MTERPRIKPHLSVEIAGPEQVFLLDETRAHILEGRAYPKVLPLLDGMRTTGEILETLAGDLSMQELFAALAILERRGYVSEGDADGRDAVAAYWSRLDLPPALVAEKFKRSRCHVRAVGDADTGAITAALTALKLSESAAADADVQVVVTDDYLNPALAEINREALERKQPWMLIRPAGTMPWIGPIFTGDRPCWECLRMVLEQNRHIESFLEKYGGPIRTAKAAIPASVGVAAGLAASELARWLAAGESPWQRSLVTFDLLSLELREHIVRPQPHCPACAATVEPPSDEMTPIVLESRAKRFTSDGGHRVVTPEETWKRLEPLVSPITGVATSLLRKDERENGLTYSYATGHAFAVVSSDIAAVQQNMRFRSGGKGMSDVQARVSGVCEAIERYSGVWRGTEHVVMSSRRALGEAAVDLNDVMLFSEAQFANRKQWNAACSPTHYHVVPEPFDDHAEIAWAPVWSLTNQRARYLPAAFCYYGHPEGRKFFCAADANGTAAGNTIEEAILQGLFELVERDAIAVWWYNRVPRPAIDLDSFDLPYVRALKSHYASLGRELWVLDLTHDLDIPVFAGVSRRINGPSEDLIVSFGAHLDPTIALTRALTETNQFLPALSRTKADGTTAYMYADPDAIEWWKTATIANQPYVAPDTRSTARTREQLPSVATADLKLDIEMLVSGLAERGLEVLVLDQTRADVGFPVVKVVVPGLRHFWRRLGPGRLYEVPVERGWLPAPPREADLNPMSMFF